MTKELEDDLRRVISGASERAPHPPTGFPAQIMARSRRRRTRAQALVAALAVVIVAGGAGVAVRGVGDDRATTAAHPTPASSPTAGLPDPIEKVWPQAVRTIPAKLPDGTTFRPWLFLDDHTVLLFTWKSLEKPDALYAYDLETGQTRKIVDIPTSKKGYASGYAVGGGRVIWQTIEGTRMRLWSVPITGGKPAAIATGGPIKGRADALAVAGDKLAFSLSEGGVFTVPLEGGSVTPVAGADRHHILGWPWVGTPDVAPDNVAAFGVVLNVETGETRKAFVRPGDKFVRCGVTTCVGMTSGGKPFYRQRDGSQEREIPRLAWIGLADDRIVAIDLPRPPGGQALFDLTTGKSGDLGLRPEAEGGTGRIGPGFPNDRLVAYERDGRYVLIDLTKIR
ncbi:TolB family protein [Nonomuraea sp. H19]|uniref:TolB family protein n=1 Tax=Nonomuraea sp. H19 TaxID=3452206 RepID=UPI003F88EFE2